MTANLFKKLVPGEQENPKSPEAVRPGPGLEREAPETKIEQTPERSDRQTSPEVPSPQRTPSIPAGQRPVPLMMPMDKSETLVRIEAVLEEDLADTYFKMDEPTQKRFKLEGEKTAQKIEQLLSRSKLEAKNILKLILSWLKIIPGISKFFIEQEAKIKTDKILKLKK